MKEGPGKSRTPRGASGEKFAIMTPFTRLTGVLKADPNLQRQALIEAGRGELENIRTFVPT